MLKARASSRLNEEVLPAPRFSSVVPPKELPLRELAETYLEHGQSSKRLKPGTLETYRKALRAAEGLAVDGILVLEHDAGSASAPWAQHVHDALARGRGGATADKLVKLFAAASTWGHKRALVDDANPWATVDRYGSPPPRVAFPRGWLRQQLNTLEAARQQAVVPPRAADFWTFTHTVAARPWCEVATLRWCDLDLAGGAIIFGQSKGEGATSRAIPLDLLGELGRAALERQRGLCETWVWPGERSASGYVGETTIMKHWPKFVAFAAERGVMTTDLDGRRLTLYVAARHGAASYWADELGLQRDVVARLLGHAPGSRSVDRYTHLSVASLVEPARRIAASLSTRPEVPMVATSSAPQQLGIDRRRLYRLATTLPPERVLKPNGERYSERAIESWRKDKLPPHNIMHGWALAAGLSMGWLYGEGDESLLPSPPATPLFPPPTGGAVDA